MVQTKKVIAILCSDIHLSHRAPVSRSAEPDWYAAMSRQLSELIQIADEYNAAIVCAGDVFDKWNSPPELINFALRHLPKMMWTIPGQHDLPNHLIELERKSAYGTMMIADHLSSFMSGPEFGQPDSTHNLKLYGFPWGTEIEPLAEEKDPEFVHLAVIHKYIWKKGKSYPGAPEEGNFKTLKKKLKGYDAVVIGDNHKPWTDTTRKDRKINVINCGSFYRRTADEVDHKPRVGLLMNDGTIELRYLDTSKDRFSEEHLRSLQSQGNPDLDVSGFIGELKSLGADSLDFRNAVDQYIKGNDVEDKVARLLRYFLED